MKRVLLIEDNAEIVFGLTSALRHDGAEVQAAGTGYGGLALVETFQPEIVILDIGLPDVDGFTILEQLRRAHPALPVVMLTARGEDADVVRGLHLGADDYVTKPIALSVLRARLRAALRRAGPREPASEVIRFGDVVVEVESRQVTRAGVRVDLAPKEFELLLALWHRDGAVATRQVLLQEVWGYAPGIRTRTVDIHIRQLRAKIEPEGSAEGHIRTVWGVGYRLVR